MVTSHGWSMETRWKGRIQRLHVITVLFRPAPSCRCINPTYHRPLVFLFFYGSRFSLSLCNTQRFPLDNFYARAGRESGSKFLPIICAYNSSCMLNAGRQVRSRNTMETCAAFSAWGSQSERYDDPLSSPSLSHRSSLPGRHFHVIHLYAIF